MEVIVSKEEARGCGYRHTGPDGVGLYLMGPGFFEVCERLPFPLHVCPVCGAGMKFSRGFTWIIPMDLFGPNCKPLCFKVAGVLEESGHRHGACHMCSPDFGKHGLLWVGEKFYTPGSFMQEAVTRGISKRIYTIPHGFKIGETVVYLAHKKVIPTEGESLPAVITAFKPTHIDIIVDTTNVDELPDKARNLAEKLGDRARLVKVEPMFQQLSLPQEE